MFTTKVGGEFKWSSRWNSLLPDWATAVLNLPARMKLLVAPGKRATVNAEHCSGFEFWKDWMGKLACAPYKCLLKLLFTNDGALQFFLLSMQRNNNSFSIGCHFTRVWSYNILRLGCVTNFDMLFLVTGFIGLINQM